MTYQFLPPLLPDELAALRADIEARGVLVPVEKDETGAILDGHHRALIAESLGLDYPVVVREGWTEDQKVEHVIELNLARRHLKGLERAAVEARMRARGYSFRRIGKLVGMSPATVHADVSTVQDRTPDTAPNPRAERVKAVHKLREQGKSLRATATELGISVGAVQRDLAVKPGTEKARPAALSAQAEPDPGLWAAVRPLLGALRELGARRPALLAAAVPRQRRSATAKSLRAYGRFLVEIALELEKGEQP